MNNVWWFSRFISVAMLVTAALTGTLRDLWWLWVWFWLLTEVGNIVSARLIYWQRRYITSLKEEQVLNLLLDITPCKTEHNAH